MFNISIWCDNDDFLDSLLINFIYCNKVVCYDLYHLTLKDAWDVFVTNMVIRNVDISWIIDSKEELKFDFDHNCPNCILNFLCYNTTICEHLYSSLFDDYFKTSLNDRYNLYFLLRPMKNCIKTC